MVRGRGGFGRGGFRGSGRGNWNSGYGDRSSPDRFFGGGKYNERYSRMDDYRTDDYSRERHSPPRKRSRPEGSRHEYGSYGNSGRYDDYASERRGGYPGDRERHIASSGYTPRREEFRKPAPPSPRGSFRGRLVKGRGGRGDRGMIRRRMAEGSYRIRKRDMLRILYKRTKSNKIRSRELTEEELAEDSDEEKKEADEGEEVTVKTEAGEEMEAGEDAEGAEDETKEATEEKEGEEKPKEKKEKAEADFTHSVLVCPQCNVKVTTFRDHDIHVRGRTHKLAMRKVAMKQRSILTQMRQAQRSTQNELEKNSSADQLASRTQFCPICKLNYKQLKSWHQGTQAHKNMKSYLNPICKICRLGFSSPMMYENHLCSFQHLKKKQRSADAADETTVEDYNLDDFTTIDSVGENETTTNADEEKEISVGIELIKKLEVHYCELCRIYLPRVPEAEIPDVLSSHCRRRPHMQRYIRRKEHEALKKLAQKLQRKESAQKKKDTDKKEGEEGDDKKDADKKMSEDDKMWDSVDKDLGELLEGEAADDDDDDSRVNGERFDRFKSDEKDGVEGSGDAKKEGDAAASAEAK